MSHPVGKRPAPLSIRLNAEERLRLQELAGSMPLSTFLKKCALGGDTGSVATRPAPTADRVLLAQVLGQLGASGLSARLKMLADSAAAGSLYVDARTASELRQACGRIDQMHQTLLDALYGKARVRPAPPTRLDELFNSLNSDWEREP